MIGLVVIVGPTGVGKSQMALELAQGFSGEIVNADSRQVYRYMDIGTSKPTLQEQALVPHHLIDLVNPDQPFTLALYQELAYRAIAEIQGRNRLPLLVGGSGLYIWAVVEGWQIPRIPPNPELRQRLLERARQEGPGPLYDELKARDPQAAQRIDPRNVRRVIRALEVALAGQKLSESRGKAPPPFPVLLLGLTAGREDLYQRIDRRIDDMVEKGLVDEVRGLMDRGYGLDLPAMSGVGYKQMGRYLLGQMDLPAAIQETKFHSHRLARHQYAWFRLGDERIHWLDINKAAWEEAAGLVSEFLRSKA